MRRKSSLNNRIRNIPLSILISVVIIVSIIIVYTLMFKITQSAVFSFFSEESNRFADQQATECMSITESVIDTMVLSMEYLCLDKKFLNMIDKRYDSSLLPSQRMKYHIEIDKYLKMVKSTSYYEIDLVLLTSKEKMPMVAYGSNLLPQLDYNGLTRLLNELTPHSDGRYYIDSVDFSNVGLLPPELLSRMNEYFLIISQNYVETTAVETPVYFYVITAIKKKFISSLLSEISFDTVNIVTGNTLCKNELDRKEIAFQEKITLNLNPKYPYVINYYPQNILSNYDYYRIVKILLIFAVIGMIIASLMSFIFHIQFRKAMVQISSIIKDYRNRDTHLKKSKIKSVHIRRTVTRMILSSILLSGLVYCGVFYSYVTDVFRQRAQRILSDITNSTIQEIDTFFDKKNFIAQAIKYSNIAQSYLTQNTGSFEFNKSDLLYLISLIGYQNANSDDIFIYNSDTSLVTSNVIFTDNNLLWLENEYFLENYYPKWLYRMYIAKGRNNNAMLNRIDPIYCIYDSKTEYFLDLIGWISLDISESELNSIYAKNIIELNGRLSVLGSDGTVLSSTEPSIIGSRMVFSQDDTSVGGDSEVVFRSYSSNLNGWIVVSFNKDVLAVNIRNFIENITYRLVLLLSLFAAIVWFICNSQLVKFEYLINELCLWEPGARKTLNMKPSSISEIDELNDVFRGMTQRIDVLIDEVYAQRLHGTMARLQMLRAQVNPHFLNNTLGTAIYMIKLGETDNAAQLLNNLGKFFRYNIKDEQQFVCLEDEIQCIQYYCNIQNVHYSGRVHVQYDLDDCVRKANIPSFILQPIVENAFIHGFNQKSGVCHLYIRCWREDKRLVIEVEDDGLGMSDDNYNLLNDALYCIEDKQKHIGIRNVAERLRLQYESSSSIKIKQNKYGGITVYISVPLTIGGDDKELLLS